jgi:murein DD-endopeptidase MepM/ murein hydrolase activator NlpD
VLLVVALAWPAPAAAQVPAVAGAGVIATPPPEDDLAPAERARLQAETAANVARLQQEGRLPREKAAGDVLFRWPVALTYGHPDLHGDAISNYVDEDPANPGHVLDYSCGTRTYDQAGYNHQGTDIYSWPFAWRKMAQGEYVAVAGAPGVIVNKQDGNFDRSCAKGTNAPANFVFVQHADGSIAWYFHLKSGGLTAKNIGDPVALGEFIGIVGSSGSSTGPHLHFELYDNQNRLVDPWEGACNARGTPSRWVQQDPYYVPRINALATSDAVPEFPVCPDVELPHFQSYFVPGATVYAVAYFRDLARGDTATFNFYRPDGSVFFSGPMDTSGMSSAVYTSGEYYYILYLPADAPAGDWGFEVDYRATTTRTTFHVGAAEPPRLTAVEYYAPSLDHYFITAFPDEQAALDRGTPIPGWARTGATFAAYANAGPRNLPPACRFYGTPGLGVNSHFYTVIPTECAQLKLNPGWTFEANAFNVASPVAGQCPGGTRPLYRIYNNGMRASPNHRFVTDFAAASAMTAAGWLLEGTAMCLPQ